jgi:hypothetical protein
MLFWLDDDSLVVALFGVWLSLLCVDDWDWPSFVSTLGLLDVLCCWSCEVDVDFCDCVSVDLALVEDVVLLASLLSPSLSLDVVLLCSDWSCLDDCSEWLSLCDWSDSLCCSVWSFTLSLDCVFDWSLWLSVDWVLSALSFFSELCVFSEETDSLFEGFSLVLACLSSVEFWFATASLCVESSEVIGNSEAAIAWWLCNIFTVKAPPAMVVAFIAFLFTKLPLSCVSSGPSLVWLEKIGNPMICMSLISLIPDLIQCLPDLYNLTRDFSSSKLCFKFLCLFDIEPYSF